MGEPMPPTQPSTKLTLEDYMLFPDDGQRHELIDGEHYVSPSPVMRHQRIITRLLYAIYNHLQANPVGEVFVAPFTTILSNYDVVEPDLLYVSNERRHVLAKGDWVRGAPDLVIEVLSPSTRKRDETIKRQAYERTGVDEYWLVDPERIAITIHRRDGNRFVRAADLTRAAGDVLVTPLIPGLELALTTLLA
jgi:Uma2 family endonuclease